MRDWWKAQAWRFEGELGRFWHDGFGRTSARNFGRVHGNTADGHPAILYKLVDKGGNLVKWGIHNVGQRRYTDTFLETGFCKKTRRFFGELQLVPVRAGPRDLLLRIERWLVEHSPGPLNHEVWAGKGG